MNQNLKSNNKESGSSDKLDLDKIVRQIEEKYKKNLKINDAVNSEPIQSYSHVCCKDNQNSQTVAFLREIINNPDFTEFVLDTEKKLDGFIVSLETQLIFPPFPPKKRKIIHNAAEYFCLSHYTREDKTKIYVNKQECSSKPSTSISSFLETPDYERKHLKTVVPKIMKRETIVQSSSPLKSLPKESTSDLKMNNQHDKGFHFSSSHQSKSSSVFIQKPAYQKQMDHFKPISIKKNLLSIEEKENVKYEYKKAYSTIPWSLSENNLNPTNYQLEDAKDYKRNIELYNSSHHKKRLDLVNDPLQRHKITHTTFYPESSVSNTYSNSSSNTRFQDENYNFSPSVNYQPWNSDPVYGHTNINNARDEYQYPRNGASDFLATVPDCGSYNINNQMGLVNESISNVHQNYHGSYQFYEKKYNDFSNQTQIKPINRTLKPQPNVEIGETSYKPNQSNNIIDNNHVNTSLVGVNTDVTSAPTRVPRTNIGYINEYFNRNLQIFDEKGLDKLKKSSE
ncbi:hypothetical protein BB559_000238 [Furculomyces boomerangus]|uniref:R3H domain-containing protein n=1 Tax=Furculomyces boomerangus TaxID=61424 RepID=A0A2T9Z5X8_9FUNG|nr:hypothetical protein BB559_000238 [Furculomyces boomerangus]